MLDESNKVQFNFRCLFFKKYNNFLSAADCISYFSFKWMKTGNQQLSSSRAKYICQNKNMVYKTYCQRFKG